MRMRKCYHRLKRKHEKNKQHQIVRLGVNFNCLFNMETVAKLTAIQDRDRYQNKEKLLIISMKVLLMKQKLRFLLLNHHLGFIEYILRKSC